MSGRKRSIFSYSKSEFRGILVLAVLIAVLMFIRIRQYGRFEFPELVISESVPAGRTDQDQDPEFVNRRIGIDEPSEKPVVILPVDPNLADFAELTAAGLSSKAASNLIRYREAGGRFTEVRDLTRIYGLDSAHLAALAHNFIIKPAGNEETGRQKAGIRQIFRIELNGADPAELAMLPGIGEVLAVRITKYRELLGGYYSVDQLSEVYGIDDSLKNSLFSHLSVDTGLIKKTNLNRASFEALKNHPYINSFQARSIMEFCRLKGSCPSVNTLINNHLISYEEYEKLRHYLVAKTE